MSNHTTLATRRHKRFYMSAEYSLVDAEQVTQLKKLFEKCSTVKVLHLSKGTSEHGDNDVRRFVGTIHVWERW